MNPIEERKKARKQEKRWLERECTLTLEAKALPELHAEPDGKTILPYLIGRILNKRPPISGPLRYTYMKTRFLGGASGGLLGAPFCSNHHLPQGYRHQGVLDDIAEEAAKRIYGTEKVGQVKIARALGLEC